MNREDLRAATKEIVEKFPDIGRRELGLRLGVSEDTARHLKTEVQAHIFPPGMTTAYFDLETTDLVGDFGQLLCGSIWSYPSGEMTTYRIDEIKNKDDFSDDCVLAELIRNKLEEHHMIVGYFSKGFDVPFLNTRLADNGCRMLKSQFHFDPIWHFKGWRGLKLRSSKMKVVANFLGLEAKQDVDIDVWKRCLIQAAAGNSEKMDTLVERCESDVRITAQIAKWAWDHGYPKTIQRYP